MCDQVDAALVVNRFDCDEDKSLSFWEFANIFLPVQQKFRDELERRLAVWDLTPQTRNGIKNILEQVLDNEKVIEGIR